MICLQPHHCWPPRVSCWLVWRVAATERIWNKIMLIDVKKAFLCETINRRVYIILPEEDDKGTWMGHVRVSRRVSSTAIRGREDDDRSGAQTFPDNPVRLLQRPTCGWWSMWTISKLASTYPRQVCDQVRILIGRMKSRQVIFLGRTIRWTERGLR